MSTSMPRSARSVVRNTGPGEIASDSRALDDDLLVTFPHAGPCQNVQMPIEFHLFDQIPLVKAAVARHHRAESHALESAQSDGGAK